MSFKNKTVQKFISGLLIILILAPAVLLSIPQKIYAQGAHEVGHLNAVPTGQVSDTAPVSWIQKVFQGLITGSSAVTASQQTTDTALHIKDFTAYLLRLTLQTFARRLLQQMTQATVNWINTGFHGQPLFLENPGSFFKDIAKSEIKDLVNIVGYNNSSYPFGKSFALNVINGYKSTFANNAQYSLSKVINDPVLINNYVNNFSLGGWNGFMLNTQYHNNYIGFQLSAANELAKQLRGTEQNPAGIIRDTLAQGQGFLSPQACPNSINPNYNNMINEFKKPTFKPPCTWSGEDCSLLATPPQDAEYNACLDADKGEDYCSRFIVPPNNPEYDACIEAKQSCEDQNAIAHIDWAKTNTCLKPDGTSGLVNTTPGSVVGAQITKALFGSTFDQTSLAAAMGNSLSAIFDALLNKLTSSGLNALTSRKNDTNNNDNFNYNGLTLGGPDVTTTGAGFDWTGAEQVITLSTLKTDVQSAIDNANNELKLIDGSDTATLGILQVLAKIWPEIEKLDACLPGPDLGWQDRLGAEMETASQGLQAKMVDSDPAKVAAATKANNELKSAVDSFKTWITNKVNTELPGSSSYVYTVGSIKTIQDEAADLTARKNALLESLAKLQSAKAELDTLTAQPAAGSAGESTLIRLKQGFDAMIIDLPTTTTVNDAQNKLGDANDKLTNLIGLTARCTAERGVKGWANTGGKDSKFKDGNTEEDLFCNLPIAGGKSHDPFINAGTVAYPDLPLVNATNVYPSSSGVIDDQIDINMSCDTIFKSYATDYQKNLPS